MNSASANHFCKRSIRFGTVRHFRLLSVRGSAHGLWVICFVLVRHDLILDAPARAPASGSLCGETRHPLSDRKDAILPGNLTKLPSVGEVFVSEAAFLALRIAIFKD